MTDLERKELENLIGKEVTLDTLRDISMKPYYAILLVEKNKGVLYGFDEDREVLKNRTYNITDISYVQFYTEPLSWLTIK